MKDSIVSYVIYVISMFVIVVLLAIFCWPFVRSMLVYETCEGRVHEDPDLYYSLDESECFWINSNVSSDNFCLEVVCSVRNRTAEAEDLAKKMDRRTAIYDCFEEGEWFEHEYDLFEDYNLSCEKIGYYNDHLLTRSDKKDGGRIEGSFTGFFSSGRVSGKLNAYAARSALATERLPKSDWYHLDCRNETVRPDFIGFSERFVETLVVEYYDDADFVNYYAQNCLAE